MKLRILTAGDLQQVLPMTVAIEAMKQAFVELSSGQAIVPQRLTVPVEEFGGVTLVKPALTAAGLGAKLVSVFPRNPERGLLATPGIVVALDRHTGYPIGICEGTYLTALRTGAAVGAATDLLARPDSKTAAVIGCGGQARTLIEALDSVRELDTFCIFDRDLGRATRLAEEMEPYIKARIVVADEADEAVAGADLISTATTSATPVFDGRLMAEGSHLNGIGSFTSEMQEVDVEAIRRSRVFVDSLSAAMIEAGDLLLAQKAGATRFEEWTEIGAVFNRSMPGRQADDEVTFFKTVGVAVQDVTAAAWALRRAAESGVGTLVEI